MSRDLGCYFRGGSCHSYQECGPGPLGIFPLFGDSLSRWDLERGRDRNGVFRPCRGILEAQTQQSLCIACGVVPLSGLEDSITQLVAWSSVSCCHLSVHSSRVFWALHSGCIQGCIVDVPVGEGLPTHLLSLFWPGGHCFSSFCLWKNRSFFGEDEPHSSEGF